MISPSLYIKKFVNGLRAQTIKALWQPAGTQNPDAAMLSIMSFIFKLIHSRFPSIQKLEPSQNFRVNGNYSNLNLTDKMLANDLPFILARKSTLTKLDLANNQISFDTIDTIERDIVLTKIREIDLSNNKLDDATQKGALRNLFGYSGLFHSISVKNCGLTEDNIAALIKSIQSSSSLTKLDISGNQATESQIEEINAVLERNKQYDLFKTKYQKGNVLDFSEIALNAKNIKHLAFYLEQEYRLFIGDMGIKEIKMPNLDQGVKDEHLSPLIQALKNNTQITHLTMSFIGFKPEIKQEINQQLMLNKAFSKLVDKEKTESSFFAFLEKYIRNYGIKAGILTRVITSNSNLPGFEVFIGAVVARFSYKLYFENELKKAKKVDFTKPENAIPLQRGAAATDSWLAYVDPRTYTPMAYLGHAIKQNKLQEQYDVKPENFPLIKPRA